MLKVEDTCVLLVDDDELIRAVLAAHLELEGFLVITASSGREAIKVLGSQTPHFVLSDVRMADGDGILLLRYIRERFQGLPHVALCSGYTEIPPGTIEELGAVKFIPKPPDMHVVIELIRSTCQCDPASGWRQDSGHN